MEVGDLVQLSAYGKKLQVNQRYNPNDFGVIIRMIGLGAFIVMWQNQSRTYDWTPMHWRKELKHARKNDTYHAVPPPGYHHPTKGSS